MLPIAVLILCVCVLIVLAAHGARWARFLDVNPRYRKYLKWHRLHQVEDFLALPAVIISGHPNRNVARVTIGHGARPLRGYLKREHRVYWRDYLMNAWAGFGWVSRSYREWLMLCELRRQKIRCPEVIAAGQDGNGKAFLLLREVDDAQELRGYLRDPNHQSSRERRVLARKLGRLLARLHRAGFSHGDLNATHVLVDANGLLHLADWQRSRQRRWLGWQRRFHDLAMLDATLSEELASPRDRLACLRSYLRENARWSGRRAMQLSTARAFVAKRTEQLLCKRYIRELRQSTLSPGTQNLIWLDGEALCVTQEFHASLYGRSPDWLKTPDKNDGGNNDVSWSKVNIPGAHTALLVRRRAHRPWHWLWSWLRGRPFTAPEFHQAAALFRLQRYGVATPKLLAVGQRHLRPWQTESFLLTETPPTRVRLLDWLAAQLSEPVFIAEHKRIRQVLTAAGRMLHRMHEAGCYLADAHDDILVETDSRGGLAVLLGNVTTLETRRRPSRRQARHDLIALCRRVAPHVQRRTDVLRFVRAYAGTTARRLIHDILRVRAEMREHTGAYSSTRLQECQESAHHAGGR